MNYYKIYLENEGQYRDINRQKFREFITEFGNKTGLINLKVINSYENSEYEELYYRLREFVLTKHPEYRTLFYEILEQKGFQLKDEILLAMRIIGNEANTTLDSNIKDYLLLSPYINEIRTQEGKFYIQSNIFGDFSFDTTYHYLQNNPHLKDLFDFFLVKQHCYQASWELIKYLKDASLVTFLLPSYFEGNYYHAVVKDDKDLYIDLAYGCVYDEEVRKKLLAGEIVSEIKKEKIQESLEIAKAQESLESKKEDLPPTLVLALYDQSKNMTRR